MFVIAKTGGFIDNNQTHRNYATTSNGDVMQLSNSGPNANDPLCGRRFGAGISRTFGAETKNRRLVFRTSQRENAKSTGREKHYRTLKIKIFSRG